MSDAPEYCIKSYGQEVRHLREPISRAVGLVESCVRLARDAVIGLEDIAATRAVELDPSVDAPESEIRQPFARMIVPRHSVADDRRHLVAASTATVDFERIGDHARNIVEAVYLTASGEALTEARPKSSSVGYAMTPDHDQPSAA